MMDGRARATAFQEPLSPDDVVRRIERVCIWYLQLAIMLLAVIAFGWLFRITGQVLLDFAGSLLFFALALQAVAPSASWTLRRIAQRHGSDLSTGPKLLVLTVWLLAAIALMPSTLAALHGVIDALAAPATRP